MAMRGWSVGVRCALVCISVFLLAMPAAGQRVRQISEFLVNNLGNYAVDDAGSVAFFVADVDPLGTNPDLTMQVFKMGLPGGALTQVTTFDSDVGSVGVSDDGATILFVSAADPLGTNADRGAELFLADASGGSLVQLTDLPDGGGDVYESRLSGDGSTALFVSDGDFTGGNPSGYLQLFVADTTGGGITQVTAAAAEGLVLDFEVSDDGNRIAFIDNRDLTGSNADGTWELFTVNANGTGLTQVTAHSTTDVEEVALSGSGVAIAYADSISDLYTVIWGSTVPTLRDSSAQSPTITDTGFEVYYEYSGGPYSIRMYDAKTGTPSDVWSAAAEWDPVISGSGNRLLFWIWNDGQPYFSSPNARGLLATDGAGQSPEEVVDIGELVTPDHFEISADGRWIVFTLWGSEVNLLVADAQTDTVTELPYAGDNPSISDDGSAIVFNTMVDLVPEHCPGVDGGIYRVGPDGTGLLELAPDPATCNAALLAQHAMIAGDGSEVVFQTASDTSGTDTGGGAELYGVLPGGGPISQVTNENGGTYKNPRIDGTGTWTVYHSDMNPTGQNPAGDWQVFRIRMDGTGLEQISTAGGVKPDVSASGERIVYHSYGDPLGTNPDFNLEIFLYDTTTSTTEQLTLTTGGDNKVPQISANGRYVAFASTAPWVSSTLGEAVYRIDLATDEVQLASAGPASVSISLRYNGTIAVSNSGTVAFESYADLTGDNPDDSVELWLAEFDAPPWLEPSAESPTVVRWGPLPWALSYDVIRGDVANLAPGAGGTVDLGAVVCLENDSDDASTLGFEDTAEPTPGQVLFYLHRAWRGDLVGDGSWGEGTGGADRLPASGACPDGP